jgi:hypothetical protein
VSDVKNITIIKKSVIKMYPILPNELHPEYNYNFSLIRRKDTDNIINIQRYGKSESKHIYRVILTTFDGNTIYDEIVKHISPICYEIWWTNDNFPTIKNIYNNYGRDVCLNFVDWLTNNPNIDNWLASAYLSACLIDLIPSKLKYIKQMKLEFVLDDEAIVRDIVNYIISQ